MLKIGCMQMDITPAEGEKHYLRGYASRNFLSDQVEEKICAGVTALEQDSNKVLILTFDSAGITMAECETIRNRIMQRFPYRKEEIFICASHTHFAPGFSPFIIYREGGTLDVGSHEADTGFFSFVMKKVLQGIEEALSSMEQVRLFQADLDVSSVAFNRRTIRKDNGKADTNYIYPEDPQNYDFSPVDTVLHVWKFIRAEDNSPKAVLARYSCHPVTGGKDLNAVSSDYIGYFRDSIRKEMDCEAFFLLGTAGDAVPLQRQKSARKWIGETLANALFLGERLFRETTDSFTLQTAVTYCEGAIPFMKGKYAEDLLQEWDETLKAVSNKVYQGDFYTAGMRHEAFQQYGAADHVTLPVQMLRLGDRTLLGLPFEVLTILGRKIREKFPEAVIISICGGYEGYLALAEDHPKGGYETEQGSVFAPDTGDMILERSLDLLKSVSDPKKV